MVPLLVRPRRDDVKAPWFRFVKSLTTAWDQLDKLHLKTELNVKLGTLSWTDNNLLSCSLRVHECTWPSVPQLGHRLLDCVISNIVLINTAALFKRASRSQHISCCALCGCITANPACVGSLSIATNDSLERKAALSIAKTSAQAEWALWFQTVSTSTLNVNVVIEQMGSEVVDENGHFC